MRIGLNLGQRQELRLLQTPQMIQAMQILQQPLLELKERIEQELQENVFLELEEPKQEEAPPGEDAMPQAEDTARREDDLSAPVQALYETLEDLEKRSSDYRQPAKKSGGDDEDPKYEALQNTAARGVTLAEHLLEQLALLELTPTLRQLIELVILNLDENGRLLVTDEELVMECGGDATVDLAAEAIAIVQTLDPPGVAARDIKECLFIQLDLLANDHTFLKKLIAHHLEDILKNRLPKVARQMDCSLEVLKESLLDLRSLNPNPGSEFGRQANYAIIPDVVVTEVDGDLEVRVERESIPTLQISPVYKRLLKDARKDRKVYEYLKKKIEAARSFIDAISQRQSTLKRISDQLVAKQRHFIDKGVEYLKPMRMQDMADVLGIHISTVSRAVSGKYMQAPRGIFEMRRFFSAGTTSADGKELSQLTIKRWVKELIDEEDKTKPYSDDELVVILHKKKNIKLARRTITKYRKALSIPSSRMRKSF